MQAENPSRNPGALRWKGTLAKGSEVLRATVVGVLALTCATMSFTQLGFLGFGLSGGGSVYLVLMLAPVALGAMLLGTTWGAALGLFGGAALYLHAITLPLDYYELTFVTPVTSIVMLCTAGFLLGILFALAMRHGVGWRRMLAIAVACLTVSVIYTVGFETGAVAALAREALPAAVGGAQVAAAWAEALRDALVASNTVAQALGDFALMALVSCVGLACAERGLAAREDMGLRMSFATWLSAAVLAAFMVSGTAAYVAVTAGEFDVAATDMRDEAAYLLGQVERSARYNGEVADAIVDAMGDDFLETPGALEVIVGNGRIDALLDGYAEDADGLVAVAIGHLLVGTDAERFDGAESLSDVLDADMLVSAERSMATNTLARVVYEGPSTASDLVGLALPGSADSQTPITRQVGYLMAIEGEDGYRVIIVRPASMVFSGRGDVMLWVALSSLALLLAVFVLASRLLDVLVARQLDADNAVLTRVAEGDLDARAAAEGTRELRELAAGINGGVGAIQAMMAEQAERVAAELATARTIQASALPGTFPPFPDIQRFDIYASMDAAREVGGDFYDFFLIGDDCTPEVGKLGYVIADVSGKGVPAALFMMKAMTLLRDYLQSGMEVGEAVENANRMLCEGNDAGMFVTAWIGVLDYATFHVDFVNAGHNPPLLWQADGWHWLTEKSGLPLGLFDGMPYRTHSLECEVGDQFLLYTDGVTEALSATSELFGEARLEELAIECYPLHPRELVSRVRHAVGDYAKGAEQSDDITLLALEVGVPPEEKAQITVAADVSELGRINEFIHDELDRRLCPVRAQNQLDIAVEELFVNACHYAYEGAGEDMTHTVRVTCAYSADPPSLTVEIIDGGVAFDPLTRPDAATANEFASVTDIPIGGLGILMAKKSVDEMRYERAGDSNVVTLVKRW